MGRQELDRPARCLIRVQGVLDASWSPWFADFSIEPQPDSTTLLAGRADQAALHGLLDKIRDLGLRLLEVRVLGDEEPAGSPPDHLQ